MDHPLGQAVHQRPQAIPDLTAAGHQPGEPAGHHDQDSRGEIISLPEDLWRENTPAVALITHDNGSLLTNYRPGPGHPGRPALIRPVTGRIISRTAIQNRRRIRFRYPGAARNDARPTGTPRSACAPGSGTA